MIRFFDCDYCKHCYDNTINGQFACPAFPDGVPYEHMRKDLTSVKECNNGIGYEPIEENND